MQISSVHIRNFKSIRSMEIDNVENALILVGKNNTGKTSVLDAIRAVAGSYQITEGDFNEKKQNIEISMTLNLTEDDLHLFHQAGIVSQYKRYEAWRRDFCAKLPSLQAVSCEQSGEVYQEMSLPFTYVVNWKGDMRYGDGYKKNNRYIPEVFPRLYYIDTERQLNQFQEDLLMFQEEEQLVRLRAHVCMFDSAK